jgi:hypothetical protein
MNRSVIEGPKTIEEAVVTLQAPSAPAGDRLNALRFLRTCVANGHGDALQRSKINRLVLGEKTTFTPIVLFF